MNKKSPNVLAILQARLGATRLPGKPLKEVLGRPLLSYQLERLRRAKTIDKIIVATTTSAQDDAIANLCRKEGIEVFRGSEENVLERYYLAALPHLPKNVVRVTGDNPLLDPMVVDRVVKFYQKGQNDYVSNTQELTYPRGQDVEIFSFEALKRAYRDAKKPEEREHVTLYIYRHPELFKIGNVDYKPNVSSHRWTVDTQEDFDLISLIIKELYPSNPEFTMEDILALLHKHPEWVAINAHVKQKPV